MDLSFSTLPADAVPVTFLPRDLAVLMVTVTAAQAASPTAQRFARLASQPPAGTLFAPLHGAFNGPVATLLTGWSEE